MSLGKKRIVIISLILAYMLFMFFMKLTQNAVFGYIAYAFIGIYGVFHVIFWRCKKCGKNLGPIWVSYCHNCGEETCLTQE